MTSTSKLVEEYFCGEQVPDGHLPKVYKVSEEVNYEYILIKL
jgi:hypothetical protein